MNPDIHILVIDDEPQIRRALKTILTAHHFRVSLAASGAEGEALAASLQPDLIILDLGLPDIDGIEVCRRIREWSQVPIIVLSVRESERDKVIALDRGADDYLTKPFGIEELLARIRVALRHAAQAPSEKSTIVRSGDLVIDLLNHKVTRRNEEVKLTVTEFKLLAYLARNAGKVLSHHAILSNVWDPADVDRLEYLRVYIRQLRKKLEEDPENPKIIVNEPGIGYRFYAD
ncbi:MAG: sensor histidine kinase [Anaerolineae bacterium]|nr:MAG: sensor histidine kinase [Anaerolineae bacterium]